MGRLREIPRTAAFAWSTSVIKPLVATGTRAGAVDADFSDETKLEVWGLDKPSDSKPIATISTDARYECSYDCLSVSQLICPSFFDLAWSEPTKEHTEGIIAGALENGSLDLYDAAKLINGDS